MNALDCGLALIILTIFFQQFLLVCVDIPTTDITLAVSVAPGRLTHRNDVYPPRLVTEGGLGTFHSSPC
jgi:hypothetical protein